jgi:hypothetical protein
VFEPNFFLGTNFWIFTKNSRSVDKETIDKLLKWEETVVSSLLKERIERGISDGYYQIEHNSIPSGIVKIKNNTMKSLLESRFMRK